MDGWIMDMLMDMSIDGWSEINNISNISLTAIKIQEIVSKWVLSSGD